MKMSVLYFSKSGNTKRMAECIASGLAAVDGTEAGAFDLGAVDEDFVKDSAGVIIGTPTYLASMAGAVKTWLDEAPRRFKLAGKLCGAFATADYLHGGADIAIQSIISHLMVLGALAYSGGGSYGKPVIHLGPVALSKDIDSYGECFRIYGERMAGKAKELFGQ